MYPFVLIAGVMALYFMVAALQRPRPAEILAFILWSAYAVYEYYVANGTLCDANCNIRVDLLVFIPLLASATYLALQTQPRTGAVAILYFICFGLTAWLAPNFGYPAFAVAAGIVALIAAVLGLKSAVSSRK
ncbi:MAG: hypothetical protein ACRCS9_12615 [Hyphomicrobium sp.]